MHMRNLLIEIKLLKALEFYIFAYLKAILKAFANKLPFWIILKNLLTADYVLDIVYIVEASTYIECLLLFETEDS